MSLQEKIRALSDRVDDLTEQLETEEATKNALIMPFLQALGYDVFNPSEVIPEFTADIGIKKGEKIDYAVVIDKAPSILVECKACSAKLDPHNSQLFRYFATVNARLAILTNGVTYRFYSDLGAPNRMDEHPFFEFNVSNVTERTLELLRRISKHEFDIEAVIAFARTLQDRVKVKSAVREMFEEPTDEMVRLIIDPIHEGRMTQVVMDRFRPLVTQAIRDNISDLVERRLQDALGKNRGVQADQQIEEDDTPETSEDTDSEEPIETTVEELEGFFAIKSIVRDLVDTERITARDVRSYFGVLLDNSNRKPVCRLWFNRAQKYVGVFDASKKETRIPIESVDALYEHSNAIRESLQHQLD